MRESEAGEQLIGVTDFLKAHEREVEQTVDGWMRRSLPTPWVSSPGGPRADERKK